MGMNCMAGSAFIFALCFDLFCCAFLLNAYLVLRWTLEEDVSLFVPWDDVDVDVDVVD
jgi:hypothetical protein